MIQAIAELLACPICRAGLAIESDWMRPVSGNCCAGSNITASSASGGICIARRPTLARP